MISFEIFKSVEICSCLDRFLFEIAKYIYIQSTLEYNEQICFKRAGNMANIVNDYVPERNKQTQQFTMSENTHHLDSNGVVEFNYSHDSCPTCQDRLIVESEVEGCEDRIFCECCDFCCLECQCQWDEVEELVEKYLDDDYILTRMKAEDITPSKKGRNLLYKFLIRAFCGPLGKGIRKELPDCCLKGVQSLVKKGPQRSLYCFQAFF